MGLMELHILIVLSYFLIGSLIVFLVLERFTSGTLQWLIRKIIWIFSVLSFLVFLLFVVDFWNNVSLYRLNQITGHFFVVCFFLFVGLFYYIGRRKN